MSKPRVAESPEQQCYAFTKVKQRCLLEHTEDTMFCRTHQNYPNDYHARITNPTFFEGLLQETDQKTSKNWNGL